MNFSNVLFFKALNEIESTDKSAHCLLIKNIVDKPLCLQFTTLFNKRNEVVLPINWTGMIWFFKGKLINLEGSGDYYLIDLMRLVKLQAFIDSVFRSPMTPCDKTPFFKTFALPYVNEITLVQQIEYWYISQVHSLTAPHLHMIPFIRATEWYQLVLFLLKEINMDESRLNQLSGKYGLSGSYFRHLCKQVLGGTVKGEISDWRLASALIDMIKFQLNATDAAYKAGYCSLSHFSKAVKKVLGYSTRDLKKIIVP